MKDFAREEFEKRWANAQELMDKDNLDAIFVTEKTNYRYFTGSQTIQFNNKQRPMTFVLPRRGKPAMMVYGLEAGLVRDETWVEDIRGYVDVPFPADLRAGDLLAVACTGAYHHSMASTLNMSGGHRWFR